MGRHRRDGEWPGARGSQVLILLLAAAWLALAGPLGPDLPPLQISYLGTPDGVPGRHPDGIAGLVAAPPGRTVAILFKGAFDFGGTDALTAALDAAPAARLVAFDSPGGRPLVADGVAQLIRARHLGTTVERYCASACTIAYLAGSPRTAGPRARFGFHLGTGPVLANLAMTVVLQLERRWFVRGGASLSFAERALHAPNPDPYFAPLDELMAAGYVHRLIGPATVLHPADPLLAEVAAIEPLTAAALIGAEATRRASGMDAARSAAITEQRAALVVDRWLARSSDAAALAWADAMLAALDWFTPTPEACMRWQIGRDDQDRSLTMLPATLHAALRTAQRQVLADANAFPVPLPLDDGTLADADSAVRRALAQAFGPRALADASSPEHGFDDPSRSCAVSTAYLRGLRQRPEGVRLLRWALGAG